MPNCHSQLVKKVVGQFLGKGIDASYLSKYYRNKNTEWTNILQNTTINEIRKRNYKVKFG